MRDVPFEMKLIGAGSDPASALFSPALGYEMPSDHDIASILRRARAERATVLVSLLSGIFGRLRQRPASGSTIGGVAAAR